jgi:hypothetical protein
MLKIVDYAPRTDADGEQFFALILQDGLQLVRSKKTGNYYATAKSTSITSTFNEETAKSMIGQEIPGTIQKVNCEPYEYTIKDTGEIITLEHRWQYFPEGETAPVEKKVVEKEPATLADHFATA